MRARDGPRGFTLLELLVVMVLAGILLSIVTISVTPDPRQSLAREARRIGQLLALAADEARIRQQPIVWEADVNGYRFVAEVAGERQLLTGDDLLRERRWERPLTRLALVEQGAKQPSQVVLGPGAPPVRVQIAREWIQPRFRLELANDLAQVAVEFDESGRGTLASN
ncbi:MAG TPA: GspH/FimT family pseudopilin [Burkholderiaceae bacterium]|jgi:general secretion pathway protein H|nr:GspH/FimT family pseudopilin [Burkholderiaceae bacterium]